MIRFLQLLGILALAAMLFAIGTISMPGDAVPTPPPLVVAPTPEPTDDALALELDTRPATIEYGAVNVIKNNGSLRNPAYNNFHVYIAFPQAGHLTDDVIYNWATNLYHIKSAEFAAVRSTNPSAIGEVNVNFDSYLIDNRYVGILFHGAYAYELTPDFETLIQTFNIDLSRQIFLETTDIFDPLQIDVVVSLLVEALIARYPDAAFYVDDADESWLTYIVMGHRGITVHLPENEFLPEHFPTISILLTYRDLGASVIIRNQLPLDEMPPPAVIHEPSAPIGNDDSDHDYEPDSDHDGSNDDGDDGDDSDYYDESLFIPDVEPQRPIIELARPMIALTFSDAPGQYINQLLDIFEQYNIRGTFGVIGNLINTDEEALVRASLNGNEIMGNSWNHRNLAKLPENEARRQILDTAEAIQAVTGVPTRLFRPPYGEVSDSMRSIAADLGLAIVNWNLDTMDWRYQDADTIVNYVLNNVRDRDIILSHASYSTTLEAYTRLIPALIAQGFQFVTVSELLQWSQISVEPGDVIYSGR